MNRGRTLLSALLGLTLLLQGFAVSAAPRTPLGDATKAAQVQMQREMPCHGQMAASTPAAGKTAGHCCNANCPDMTGCAQGAMAMPAAFSLSVVPALQAAPAFAPVRVIARTPTRPLRPPITLHG